MRLESEIWLNISFSARVLCAIKSESCQHY